MAREVIIPKDADLYTVDVAPGGVAQVLKNSYPFFEDHTTVAYRRYFGITRAQLVKGQEIVARYIRLCEQELVQSFAADVKDAPTATEAEEQA